MDLIQTWYVDRYYCTFKFDTSLIDLTLIQGHRSATKQKTFASVISQSFQWISFEWNLVH